MYVVTLAGAAPQPGYGFSREFTEPLKQIAVHRVAVYAKQQPLTDAAHVVARRDASPQFFPQGSWPVSLRHGGRSAYRLRRLASSNPQEIVGEYELGPGYPLIVDYPVPVEVVADINQDVAFVLATDAVDLTINVYFSEF